MLGYMRLEGTRLVRDVSFLVVSLISPLLMYVVLTNSAKGAGRHDTLVFLTVTMAAFGAMGAVLNSGSGIAEDKDAGWLRQLRLTPLRPGEVVLGRALIGVVAALPPILVVQLIGALANGVHHTPAEWIAAVAALWAGVAPMALLALGAGYLFRPQIAQAVAVVGYVGLSVIGGLWMPISKLPSWLRPVSEATPTHRYAELALHAAKGEAPNPVGAAILLGWLAVCAAFAVFAYRRGVQAR